MEDPRGDATSVRPIPIPIIVPGNSNSNGNEESSGQSVENVVGKVKKLIRQIAGARGSPDPRLLHKLAFIIEREEGRYQLKAGNSSTNQRSSYTIGRLVNLITDNEEFYELISSKLLLESGHSIAQRAAAARLFLSCVSCWMQYPAAFEDAVLAKIKEWVVEDEPDNVATTSSRSKEKMRNVPSEGQSRDTEVLRTFATGLLAVALGGDEVVDDIVRTGIVGTLMRFLRARVLGDSDGGRAQQKALATEEKTPAAGAVGSTSRGRGQIESHRWVEGSHSEEVRAARGRQPREVPPPPPLEDATPSSDRGAVDRGLASSIDRRGKTVERLDGSLDSKTGEEEGLVSLARELVWRQEDDEKRPREGEKVDGGVFLKRPRKDGQVDVAGLLAQPVDRGRTKKGGRLASANAVQEGQQSWEEVEGRHESMLEDEEVEEGFEGERVVVGDVDVTSELHKAVRAAETEARAAGAHAEAMKAAGEAAAETVKQAASEAVAAGKTAEEVKDAARAAAMSIHDASIVAKLAVTAQSAAAEKEATPSGVEDEEEEGEAMKWQLSSDALGYLRERFCVLCMAAMGEYLEVLGPVLHERGVDICTAMLRRPWSTWLARAQQAMLAEEAAAGGVIALSEDGRLEEDGAAVALADVLKMVCTLSAHRKFASMFVDRGGVQLLLSVPRFPQTYLGLSLCLFAFASIQGVMERVCLLPPPVLSDMVGLALQLLTCHIDMARKNAALYFGSAFVFPTIVDIFDTQDGLRHILNLLRAAAVLRSGGGVSPPPPPAVPDGQAEPPPQDHPTGVRGEVLEGFPFAPRADRAPEVLTSAGKQIAYHACVALRQYMRTNLILLVETLKPSSKTHKGGGSRSTGGGGRLAYKPVDVSNEAVEGVIMQLQRDRKLGQAFMKVKWLALEKLTDYGGVEVMLELTQALGPGEKYFNEIAQYALGVLQVATLSPISHRKVLGTVLSNDRPGMAVVLDAVSGTTFGDAEVIQVALLVLINLVCPPPSLCSRLPPGPGPAGQNAPLSSVPAPLANHGSSAQPLPPSSAIQGSERGADRAWFGGTERREEGTRGSERERMERNLVERAGPSGVVAGVVGDRRISLGVGGGGCGIAAFMEQMYRQAREAVRQHNGIKILLHLLHPRTTLLHATPDCTRALACRALLGLARDCNIAHILTKLQVGKLLSELLRDSGSQATRTSATPEEGRWKAEFHRVALELITITMNTGRASTAAASEAAAPTLRRIERAAIAAATPITYSPRELLQLVHQHLYSLNLHQTAASLLREANLTPLLSAGPAPAPVLPATPTQFTTPSADSALFASLRTPTTMAPPPASIPFLSPIQPFPPTFLNPSPQQTPALTKAAVFNPSLAELPTGRVAKGFLTEAAKPSAPPPPPPVRATEVRKRAGLLHTPRLTIVQSSRATPTPPATNVSTPVGESASSDSARAVGGGAPSFSRPRIPSIKRKFEEIDEPASPFSPPLSAAARPAHPYSDEPLSSPPAAAMRASTCPSTAATGAHVMIHDGLPPKTPITATPVATPPLPGESQQSRLAMMNHHQQYGGVGTSSSGGQMMTMPGGLGSSAHAGSYNLQGGGGSGGGSGEHATLDSIVIQYLKHQHRQCPAPITTLPPVSLLHPHVCPEPRRTLEAPLNAAARLVGARPRGPPYGGAHGKRYDRQFVYSRFRAWRSCRDESAIFTSVSFLGSASRVAVGSQEGEIRFFDSWSGDVVESYSCHNAPIHLLQSAPRGPSLGMEPSPASTGALPEAQLLLSSTRYDVRLWDTEAMASPLASFDSVRAGRFNHSATKIVALSGDSIRREVLLYDVGTAQLAQTLHVSPSFASSGNPRGVSQQGPRFNPSDTLVLWNGILWDPRISNPLHKFDQFTNYGGGGFNPNGNDVVINSEVWDLRTYKLLRSVPSLDQTAITFNATGDVIYAILRRNTDELHKMLEDDGKARHSLFSSFRTIDATDYGDIATTLVDSQQPRWVMDLAVEPTESYIAVAAIDGKMDCFARLFEVGRRRPADDDSDYDNADESEEEDSEAEDDIDDDDEDGQGEEEDAEVDLNDDGSDDGHGGNDAGPLENDSEDDEDGRFPSDDEDDELGDDILGLLNEDDEDDHMHDSDSEYSDEGSSDSDYPPAANFDDLLQRMF